MPQNTPAPTTPPPSNSGTNRKSDIVNGKSSIPTGFKPTKLGWLPEEWEVVPIGQIVNLLSGYAFSSGNYSDKGIRLLRGANVKRGDISWDDSVTKFWPQNKIGNKLEKYLLAENDLIIAMDGSLVGRSYGIIKAHDLPCLLLQRVARIRSKMLSTGFLKALVGSLLFVNYCDRVKTVTAIPHISSKDIKNFKIPLPPLPEQHRIARCLTTWDRAITTTRTLLDQLRSRKRGLMQRLLTGEVRLPGFSEEWEEVKMNDLFTEIKERNDGDDHEPMTVSSTVGLISQREKFDRVIAGKSLSKYILIKKGDFTYNKGNSKTYPMGCVFPLEEFESAVVPFVYISFRSKVELDKAFYKYWFENHGLDRQLKGIISSGARGDGLLNVNKRNFFILKLPFPPIKEQTAIARVLTSADREIELYQQKLTALETQKRGLMQQLLTGQKRLLE